MKIGKEVVNTIQTRLGPIYGNCFIYNKIPMSRRIHEQVRKRIWNNLDSTVVQITILNLEKL